MIMKSYISYGVNKQPYRQKVKTYLEPHWISDQTASSSCL